MTALQAAHPASAAVVVASVLVSLSAAAGRASGKAQGREAASGCGGEDLSEWLYDTRQWAPPGYHVLCVDDAEEGQASPEGGGGGGGGRVRLWVRGHLAQAPAEWRVSRERSLETFRAELQKRAGMKKQKRWKILPWALHHAASGREVHSSGLLRGVLLAFEGGRWVWPGIREGFERRLQLSGKRNVTMTTLTLDPLAFVVEGFVDKKMAKHIIQTAKPRLKPGQMKTTDSEQEGEVREARTCSEAWVSPKEHPRLDSVAKRTADLTRVPKRLQADFRVLQYKPGQQFVAHTDYYDKEDFENQPDMMKELKHGRNWLVTIYAYLNNVELGGETYFPSTYGKPLPGASEMGRCEGPAVSPQIGRALLFYSLHPDGKPNLSSMHGGCKLQKGIKYTVNIWTFNQGLDEAEQRQKELMAYREEL